MYFPLGILQQQTAGLPILVYDQFNDTPALVLNSHTPDINVPGNPWVRNLNTQIINAAGTGVEEDINTSLSVSTIDVAQADVVIDFMGAWYKLSGDNASGSVMARYVDSNDHCAAGIYTFSTDPWTWFVGENVAGVWNRTTMQGTTGGNATVLANAIFTLKGGALRFEVPDEGIDISETAVTHLTGTKHGTRFYNTSSPAVRSRWDEVTIYDNS